MSETDDTDDLLLIPPDLFVSEAEIIESYASGPYFNIVDSLITQISQLSNRVKSIENLDTSKSNLSTMNSMDSQIKYSSVDEIRDGYSNSTFSTPQKPRMKYRNSSLPATPLNLSPQKPVGPFTPSRNYSFSLDNHEKSSSCKLSLKFSENSDDDIVLVNGKVINLAQIENMLQDIEDQKRETESRLREKENEIVMQKTRSWRCGDDISTLPPHRKDDLFLVKNLQLNEQKFNKLTAHKVSCDSVLDDKSASISSTESSQVTTRCNPKFSQSSNARGDGDHLKFINLNDLWEQNHSQRQHPRMSLREKLEEEKLRRLHCEETILQLQKNNVELEERLAVALKVDQSKDKALLKFHNSWERIVETISILKEEREYLERNITDIQIKSAKELDDCAKKMEQYEEEASKALNLVEDHKDKINVYREKCEELESNFEAVNKSLQEAQKLYNAEVEKNKQLNEIIIEKELEINQGKNVLTTSRSEIAESKKAIELCQVEFANMKTQYTQLEEILLEKQKNITEFEKKNRNLLNDNDNLKQLHKDLQEEVGKLKRDTEKNKQELRDFYQKQVESVVKSKLKEFQEQLDKAESSLGEEIKKRELSIAKTAAGHIHQLNEKHSLEVALLEEKHREEVKFYQMQITQAQQQLENQQSKLKNLQERRALMAQELHKVMEAQWLEALKIINSNKSPFVQHDSTIDQLKTLKSKSYTNLEEVLSDRNEGEDTFPKKFSKEVATSNSTHEDFFTIKMNQESPLSSKTGKNRNQVENELQKYVNLLLNKHGSNNLNSESNLQGPAAQQEQEDKNRDARRNNKPPWK